GLRLLRALGLAQNARARARDQQRQQEVGPATTCHGHEPRSPGTARRGPDAAPDRPLPILRRRPVPRKGLEARPARPRPLAPREPWRSASGTSPSPQRTRIVKERPPPHPEGGEFPGNRVGGPAAGRAQGLGTGVRRSARGPRGTVNLPVATGLNPPGGARTN